MPDPRDDGDEEQVVAAEDAPRTGAADGRATGDAGSAPAAQPRESDSGTTA